MLIDSVNPSEGTVDAVAQLILEKSEPKAETEVEDVEEPIEDSLETETEDEVEAVDDTEEEPEQDDSEPQKFTVKVGGKDVEVTLDEALAGYMKDQDYRQKTAEVAETRKQVEAEKAKSADLQKVRESYVQELQIIAELNSKPLFTEEKLNEILTTQGPEAYLRAKAAHEKHQQQVVAIREKITKAQTEIAEDQKAQLQELQKTESEALLKAIPELSSEETKKSLVSYLSDLGFAQEQIETTLDHRLFVMAEKSRRYDEMMRKAKQKPVVKIPKVTKGDAARKSGADMKSQKLNELEKHAKRSGNVNDVARLLMAKNSK